MTSARRQKSGFRGSAERSPNARERQRSTALRQAQEPRLRPELAEGSRRSPNGARR
jgi:hypothetical protein